MIDNKLLIEILLGVISVLSAILEIQKRFFAKSDRTIPKTDSPIIKWYYICFWGIIIIIVLVGAVIDPLIRLIVGATIAMMLVIAVLWKILHRS